jgi:DNA-binding XRE family transcriptional regulator
VKRNESLERALRCEVREETGLKRLVSKKGYSQEQIASEIRVTKITVNHWCTGYSLTAKQRKYGVVEEVFSCSFVGISQ